MRQVRARLACDFWVDYIAYNIDSKYHNIYTIGSRHGINGDVFPSGPVLEVVTSYTDGAYDYGFNASALTFYPYFDTISEAYNGTSTS